MDSGTLCRFQFALTAAFHFLFPPISIGLAWLLTIIEWRAWRRRDLVAEASGRFFAKILGLTFVVGVATGIPMEFQFGMNWSRYSKFVGDIFGAPLAAEAVFTFFLESGFLGLYLFGRKRVSKKWHWFAIFMVAVGSTMSAFWILAANSWMQTPAGYVIQNGRAELTNFAQAIFNPSMLPRFFHTFIACLVAGGFFMSGISAALLLRDKRSLVARYCLKVALIFSLVFSILVAFPSGHEHAKQVARTQPAKFAAIEGMYTSRDKAPLVMFAIPFMRPPELKGTLEIPGLLSWMAFGDIHAKVPGITEFPADQLPPLWLTFVSFHNMVVLGMYFIFLTILGAIRIYRGTIFSGRWFLKLLVWSIPLPLIACQLGWITAEVGRQPWAVYGVLRTSDAFSTNLSVPVLLFSITLFSLMYLMLGTLYIYLLVQKIKHGPDTIGISHDDSDTAANPAAEAGSAGKKVLVNV
ncbi:cytochrome ubiquinol oxidase subunit I [soil metagenome]